MLHSFDGIELLEHGVNYAERDGDIDCWLDEPETPVLVRSEPPETVEQEDGFYELRQKLLTNFTFRDKEGTILWKRSQGKVS